MKIVRSILEKYKLTLIWDLIMVGIVLTNLSLILFDLSYLRLRTFYINHLPVLVDFYDKNILGIQPHRDTEGYRKLVSELSYFHSLEDPEFQNMEFRNATQKLANHLPKLEKILPKGRFLKNSQDFISLVQSANPDPSLMDKKLSLVLEEVDEIDKVQEVEDLIELSIGFKNLVKSFEKGGLQELYQKKLTAMDKSIYRITMGNSFQNSGQFELYQKIKEIIRGEYAKHWTKRTERETRTHLATVTNTDEDGIPNTAIAFSYFWREDPRSLSEKITFYQTHLDKLFALNYFRTMDKTGSFVNNYIYLDAPFLFIFLVEFLVGWYIAIRDKVYVAWFLYPVYHWYDVLGLIPIVEFRVFRLVRLYKMYLILSTNQYTQFIGNDFISRSISNYLGIIKEEISDMVSIQILTETQADFKQGGSIKIMTNAIDAHRDEIKSITLRKLQEAVASPRFEKVIDSFINIISTNMIQNSGMVNYLPKSVQENISKSIGIGAYHTIKTALQKTLLDDAGLQTVNNLLDYMIDEFNEISNDKEFNALYSSINVELLENVKKSILEKNWAERSNSV